MTKKLLPIEKISYILIVFVSISAFILTPREIDAHNFVSDDVAYLLSLIIQMNVELEIFQKELVNNNISSAQDHIIRNEDLANLIVSELDNILDSEDKLKDKLNLKDNSKNSTVQALVFANIVDAILENYGDAYRVKYDMTDMTIMAKLMNNSNNNVEGLYRHDLTKSHNTTNVNTNNNTLFQEADYQTAKALSVKSYQIFRDNLQPLASLNQIHAFDNLEKSLIELHSLISNKASPVDIMMTVHTMIHPTLQKAFSIEIK